MAPATSPRTAPLDALLSTPADPIRFGARGPLVVIAGPCLLESDDTNMRIGVGLAEACGAGRPLGAEGDDFALEGDLDRHVARQPVMVKGRKTPVAHGDRALHRREAPSTQAGRKAVA